MAKKILLDANAILRYLLDDIHEQHLSVKKAIENRDCFCILSVMQEVVYILEAYYQVPRSEISSNLLPVKEIIEIEDEDVFVSAIQHYTETPKIDFADCIMCGYQKNRNVDILTFDKKLQKKLQII